MSFEGAEMLREKKIQDPIKIQYGISIWKFDWIYGFVKLYLLE
jgi:hypothetical protein